MMKSILSRFVVLRLYPLFKKDLFVFSTIVCLISAAVLFFLNLKNQSQIKSFNFQTRNLYAKNNVLQKQLQKIQKDFQVLKNQDQYKINKTLEANIKNIEDTYIQSVSVYEKLLDLKTQTKDTKDLDALFADILNLLAQKNYSSASADLLELTNSIKKEQDKIASFFVIPANIIQSNTPPSAGFSRQTILSDKGNFLVDIVAADLNSTRVIVDTASDSDCNNNCPTLPLSDYVSRSGAFAGINGTFFCPPEYPSCAGKTNSFDTLLMNKKKYYFNSANNIYSTVPLVFFTSNSMGVRTASSNWGRDTSVDSVIAMQPLLILGGNIVFNGSNDGKFTNKGPRDFIANKGNVVYIGVIHNADMDDAAHVLKAFGLDNALNLDEGGSTALWYGGYQDGPGRNIPNAVLFIRK